MADAYNNTPQGPKVMRSGTLAPKPDNCTLVIVEVVLAPGESDDQFILDTARMDGVLTVTRIDQ